MCPCYEHEIDGCACGASALHVFNWLIILPISLTPVRVLALQLGAMSEAQLEEFSRHAGMPAGVHPSCACACAFSMCISYSPAPFSERQAFPRCPVLSLVPAKSAVRVSRTNWNKFTICKLHIFAESSKCPDTCRLRLVIWCLPADAHHNHLPACSRMALLCTSCMAQTSVCMCDPRIHLQA